MSIVPAAEAAVVAATPAAAPAAVPVAAPAAPVAPAPPAAAPVAPEAAPVVPAPAPIPQAEPVAPAAAPAAPAYQPVHADPRVNAVESMLAEKGLGAEQVHAIFEKAFQTQDVKDVDQDKLKAALGDAGAKLAMQNLEAFSADVARAAKTLYDTAKQLTGGEDAYKQFSEWVNASTDPEVHELKEAVARGGKLAYLALDALNTSWRTDSKHAVGVHALITPDGGNAGVSVTPFSNRREYVNAMKEAHKTRDATKVAAVHARFAVKPV